MPHLLALPRPCADPCNTLQVKLALCQLAVTADKQHNLATAESAINQAAANGARLVVLPEMWNCPYSNDSFPTYAEDVDGGDSPSSALLASAAASNGVVLVGGSIPERSNGKLYNTCLVYDADGKLLGRHRKVAAGEGTQVVGWELGQ